MKRKISVFLCIVISTVTLFFSYNQSVTAASAISEGVLNIAYALALHLGYVATDEAIYSVINNSDSLLARLESLIDDKNNDGTITLSEETMSEFKSLFDEYFAQEENLPDVVWMPVMKSSDLPVTLFYNTTLYMQARSYADSHTLSILSMTNNSPVYCADASEVVIISRDWSTNCSVIDNWTKNFGNDLGFSIVKGYFASRDGVNLDRVGIPYDGYYLADGSGMVEYSGYFAKNNSYGEKPLCIVYPWANIPFSTYNYCYGHLIVSDDAGFCYVPVFQTLDSYKEWVVGQSDFYRVQSPYTGGDITVNPNTDYSVVYNNISNTIQNSYAEGKDYTDILSDMQQSYESSMKEISESLGNIEDNTEESNSWLEKIYGKVSNIDNMIAQQFDELASTISNGFNSVIDSLTDISLGIGDIDGGDPGSGDGDSESTHKSFWTRLGEFCSSLITGILSLLETVIMKAVDGLLYLANVVVDNASVALNGITEYMERYIDYFGEDTFLTNLGEALPQQIKDLIVFIVFGITAAGVIYMIKR